MVESDGIKIHFQTSHEIVDNASRQFFFVCIHLVLKETALYFKMF